MDSVLDWIADAFWAFQGALDWLSVAAIAFGIVAFAIFSLFHLVFGD